MERAMIQYHHIAIHPASFIGGTQSFPTQHPNSRMALCAAPTPPTSVSAMHIIYLTTPI
jgi:hypothetical protein